MLAKEHGMKDGSKGIVVAAQIGKGIVGAASLSNDGGHVRRLQSYFPILVKEIFKGGRSDAINMTCIEQAGGAVEV